MSVDEQGVEIHVSSVGVLRADWATMRQGGQGGPLVIFAHGSGSSRRSPRNRAVAAHLQESGFGTLLLDLLTEEEEELEQRGGRLRFDVDQLADRLIAAVDGLTDELSHRQRWVTSVPARVQQGRWWLPSARESGSRRWFRGEAALISPATCCRW
jgi:hypothetical protein